MAEEGCAVRSSGQRLMLPHALLLIEDRLGNWHRWLLLGNGSQGQCGSAERNYRAPRADAEQLVRSARAPVDMLDGEAVERALCRMRLEHSARHSQLVISYYHHGERPETTYRKCRVPIHQQDTVRLAALMLLQRILEGDAVKLIRRGVRFDSGNIPGV